MARRSLPPVRRRSVRTADRSRVRRGLLACGIGYGLAYVLANDVVAAGMWDHYSARDQAISELSSTQAPSRSFLTAMNPVFLALVVAFGVGVWLSAGRSRALRAVGALLVVQGLLFPVWLLYPMTSREDLAQGVGGANDVGHIVLSAVAVSCIVAETVLSAVALGRPFRYFAIAMAVLVVAGGASVGAASGALADGGGTPWMGLVERISYGAWLAWMAGLAVVLLRRDTGPAPTGVTG